MFDCITHTCHIFLSAKDSIYLSLLMPPFVAPIVVTHLSLFPVGLTCFIVNGLLD
jgi:hypothetical protein